MGDFEEEVPTGTCQFCGVTTIYHTLTVCRECQRSRGNFSDITKNTKSYWNWKVKNDYLSKKEKELLRKKIEELNK